MPYQVVQAWCQRKLRSRDCYNERLKSPKGTTMIQISQMLTIWTTSNFCNFKSELEATSTEAIHSNKLTRSDKKCGWKAEQRRTVVWFASKSSRPVRNTRSWNASMSIIVSVSINGWRQRKDALFATRILSNEVSHISRPGFNDDWYPLLTLYELDLNTIRNLFLLLNEAKNFHCTLLTKFFRPQTVLESTKRSESYL